MRDAWRGGAGFRHWGRATLLAATVGPLALAGCGHGSAGKVLPTTTVATTTTAVAPVASALTVTGVRPGVLQAPFYPALTVTSVSCGTVPSPNVGRFVRLDLPPGAAGTPARSAMTEPTAVIVVPGIATLVDRTYRVMYGEKMPSITTATHGAFVLTLENVAGTSAGGLAVQDGALQVNGDYTCPATDVPYPGS